MNELDIQLILKRLLDSGVVLVLAKVDGQYTLSKIPTSTKEVGVEELVEVVKAYHKIRGES